jgi:hypothetical protein
VQVSIRLPSKTFDAYCARARQHDVSVPEEVRRDLPVAAKRDRPR